MSDIEGDGLEQSLYEVRRKIYPRAVHGAFARARWTLVFATQLVFYGTAWLEWNGRQALLFDLAARKFYIFGLVLWPQDIVYLSVLLVLSALSLFLFTAVAGRVWCGYACPQTVYTEIFLSIERFIEGDRIARMKLDDSATTARKVGVKAGKHAVWIVFSLWTGFTFVGYFTPIRELAASAASLSLGPWETWWMLFYGFATYGNAGWMREQVCKYMCPYARFQSAMFDPDTLVITYDTQRGEPRGSRSRRADPKGLGLGDCVDCGICVQVCPTGIDIRKGLQYECIGCAACIDGCDQVMAKLDYAPGLIRYSTENALKKKWGWERILQRIYRPRVALYCVLMATILVVTLSTLLARSPVKVDVIRDRGSLAREVEGGRIENVYRLQLMNTEERTQSVRLTVRGPSTLGRLELVSEAQPMEIAPLATRPLAVRVRAEPSGGRGSIPIEFTLVPAVEGEDAPSFKVVEKSRFVIP